MKKAGLLLVLFACFVCSVAKAETTPDPSKSYALLIGVNEYPKPFTSLRYCEADIDALEKVLLEIGYPANHIVKLESSADSNHQPTRSNILKQARAIAGVLEPEGTFIMAFSGHGATIGEDAYLCPTDVDAGDLSSLVKRDDLYAIMNDCEARHKLFFIDACRDVQTGWRTTKSIKGMTVVGREEPKFFLISSCRDKQVSHEDPAFKQGVFSHFLVEGLRGKAALNGKVSVSSLFAYVSQQTKDYVLETYSTAQTPRLMVKTDEMDDFVLSTKILPPDGTPASGSKAGERMVKTVDGVEYVFRWCPAGAFQMGSPSSESGRDSDEGPQHEVTLTKGFWMMETEVTQAMWRSVMGESISEKAKQGTYWHDLYGEGTNYPMYYVSWDDCQEFCRKLSSKIGMKITLPTEAQWEYAYRAGTKGRYAGDSLDSMGWYDSNSGGKTHPVAQKKPNAWGLYDMHGNVWEWCEDWFGDYPNSAVTDPTGPNSGSIRVFRGGGWNDFARNCRSANRNGVSAGYRSNNLGFRVVGSSQ